MNPIEIKGRLNGILKTFSICGLARATGVSEHFVRKRYYEGWGHQRLINEAARTGTVIHPEINIPLQEFCLGTQRLLQ